MRTLAIPVEDEVDEALEALSARLGRDKKELAGEALRQFVQQDVAALHPSGARPIEEVLADLGREVPGEEWDRLPSDLSGQVDHYLYGAPRR